MEQQFNTGKPPAGEAGLLNDGDGTGICWTYWDGKQHCCFSSRPNGAWTARHEPTKNALLQWRWATLPELLAAGLSEAEALPMLHSSQKPQGDGWSQWFMWRGAKNGPPAVLKDTDYIEVRFRNGEIETGCAGDWFYCWKDDNQQDDIVAYRVRLTAQQPTEPATTESDRDIDFGDGVDENAAMLARDSAGMVKAEAERPQPAPRVERCPLLVVAPMERLGATRWGAE